MGDGECQQNKMKCRLKMKEASGSLNRLSRQRGAQDYCQHGWGNHLGGRLAVLSLVVHRRLSLALCLCSLLVV